MRLKNIYGKLVYKNVKSKLIDWDGKSRSKVQRQVKKFLKDYWSKCIVYEEFPVYGSRMSVDILNATKKIAVEVQGKQHTKYVPFFHGSNKINYLNQLKRDQDKFKFWELNDIQLVEIYDGDELNDKLFLKFGVIIFFNLWALYR